MDDQKKKEELNRLCRLYYERNQRIKKGRRIRWILTIIGFSVCYFMLFMIIDGYENIFDVFRDGIGAFLEILVVSVVLSVFHFFVNASVFGGLFQKSVAENRSLDDLLKQIRELKDELYPERTIESYFWK